MIHPERALFSAVIVRAIMDARGANSSEHASAAKVNQRQAIEWLSRGGRDFETICSLAGVDAQSVREAFLSGRLDSVHLETTSADCVNRRMRGKA